MTASSTILILMKTMKNKKENIAEYVLRLWQLEDCLRAFPLLVHATADNRLSADIRFLTELNDMMHAEGVVQKGHVQLAQNALQELEELHDSILEEDATYRAAVMHIAPMLNLLKAKTDNPAMSDIEACLILLYQVMLLRLQKKKSLPPPSRYRNRQPVCCNTLAKPTVSTDKHHNNQIRIYLHTNNIPLYSHPYDHQTAFPKSLGLVCQEYAGCRVGTPLREPFPAAHGGHALCAVHR